MLFWHSCELLTFSFLKILDFHVLEFSNNGMAFSWTFRQSSFHLHPKFEKKLENRGQFSTAAQRCKKYQTLTL